MKGNMSIDISMEALFGLTGVLEKTSLFVMLGISTEGSSYK